MQMLSFEVILGVNQTIFVIILELLKFLRLSQNALYILPFFEPRVSQSCEGRIDFLCLAVVDTFIDLLELATGCSEQTPETKHQSAVVAENYSQSHYRYSEDQQALSENLNFAQQYQHDRQSRKSNCQNANRDDIEHRLALQILILEEIFQNG